MKLQLSVSTLNDSNTETVHERIETGITLYAQYTSVLFVCLMVVRSRQSVDVDANAKGGVNIHCVVNIYCSCWRRNAILTTWGDASL